MYKNKKFSEDEDVLKIFPQVKTILIILFKKKKRKKNILKILEKNLEKIRCVCTNRNN